MVYTAEDSYYHYNYIPGNTGEWSDDEGCGSYQYIQLKIPITITTIYLVTQGNGLTMKAVEILFMNNVTNDPLPIDGVLSVCSGVVRSDFAVHWTIYNESAIGKGASYTWVQVCITVLLLTPYQWRESVRFGGC